MESEDTEKATIKVGGMTCAMCSKAIENAVGDLDGVSAINVNLAAEKAYITFDSGDVGLKDFKKAVEGAGYKYLGVEGELAEKTEREMRERDLRWKMIRFSVGFIVAGPLMLLMYLMKFGVVELMPPGGMGIYMLAITTPVFIFVSYPIFIAAFKALRNRNLDMNVMYAMGIGVAFVSSVMGTFEFVLTPAFMFYDTAVMLAAFLTLGRYLEARAKGRTSDAIKKLMGLRPKTAIVIRGKKEVEVDIDDVQLGDIVLVKPGDKVPVDGKVVKGESFVDESMITGEPIPPLRKRGDKVVGGTLNKNSVLRIKAQAIGKDTVLSQIIKLVEEAQGSKPPVQRLADQVVAYFIPVILVIAIVAFIVWMLVGLVIAPDFIEGSVLLFALTVLISILVVACPCALGLATPTAVTVGIGRGAELGVLVKEGEALEVSQKLTTVMFDKTGTLTKGQPEVTDIFPMGVKKKDLIRLAGSVEKNSQHPLAEAVVRQAKRENVKLATSKKFDTYGGKGVSAVVENKEVLLGNRTLLKQKGIAFKKAEKDLEKLEKQGKTGVLMVVDGKLSGVIGIADPIKATTKRAIDELKKMDIKVVMVTGDNRRTAQAIAREIGIENVRAQVLPQDKAWEVRDLQEKGEVVAFIGDGINDAPALAQADVGVAIGSGTDVAMESGEIVLIKDDLVDAVGAIQLSKKVMTRIKQNLFWAFFYNTILVPLAAGLLFIIAKLAFDANVMFPPELAGAAMAMSSVTVITLSLMLKGYVPPAMRK
jgi:Cu+-exporting ATPase